MPSTRPDSYTPVRPEDLKAVQGHSGQGLQIVCPSCGCINWNHFDMPESIWSCRNCKRVFTYNYPLIVEQYRRLYPPPAADPGAAIPAAH